MSPQYHGGALCRCATCDALIADFSHGGCASGPFVSKIEPPSHRLILNTDGTNGTLQVLHSTANVVQLSIMEEDEGDGDGDGVGRRMKKELNDFANVRSFTSSRIRVRTITTSVNASVRDGISPTKKAALLRKMNQDSKALGVLRHLVSVFLNVLADEQDNAAARSLIFQESFVNNLFTLLSGKKLRKANKKKPRRLEDPSHVHIRTWVDTYIEQNNANVSEETLALLKSFPARGRDTICRSFIKLLKRHVTENFEQKTTQHFICAVDQVVSLSPGDEGVQNVKKSAASVIKACYSPTRAQASSVISSCCDKHNLHAWRPALESLVDAYRQVYEPLRDCPGKPSPEALLQVLSYYRKKDKELVERKEETWRTIDMLQPQIVASKINGKYRKETFQRQRDLFLQVPLPSWLDSDEPLTEKEVHALLKNVSRKRKSLWDFLKSPGMDSVPKRFSLLPVFSIQRAFVQYDNYGIRTLARKFGSHALRDADSPAWWTSVFDFHNKERVSKRSRVSAKDPRVARRDRKRNRKRRKLLKQKRRFDKSIGLCACSPWVAKECNYKVNKENPTVPVPWLVNSITTDGLQVKLTLATIVETPSDLDTVSDSDCEQMEAACPTLLPPGVSEIVQERWKGIQDTFSLTEHRRGLFRNSAPVRDDLSEPVHVIGVDPGQVNIATTARVKVDPTRNRFQNSRLFAATDYSGNYVSSKEYRFESLARHTEKVEKSRVVGEFKEALCQLSKVTLRVPGEARAFATTTYRNLDKLITELMSEDRQRRRFARFRARQRNVHNMARRIAFGEELELLRRERGKMKRMRKKELWAQRRVVFSAPSWLATGGGIHVLKSASCDRWP